MPLNLAAKYFCKKENSSQERSFCTCCPLTSWRLQKILSDLDTWWQIIQADLWTDNRQWYLGGVTFSGFFISDSHWSLIFNMHWMKSVHRFQSYDCTCTVNLRMGIDGWIQNFPKSQITIFSWFWPHFDLYKWILGNFRFSLQYPFFLHTLTVITFEPTRRIKKSREFSKLDISGYHL